MMMNMIIPRNSGVAGRRTLYRNTPVSLSSWRSSTQFPTRVPCSSRLLKPVKGSSSFDIVAESATGSGTSRSSPVHVRDWQTGAAI